MITWFIKRLTRQSRKNLLLILTVFAISILFSISAAVRENSASQLRSFLSTYKVTAYYMRKEFFYIDRPGGNWLWPSVAEVPIRHSDYLLTYSLTRNMSVTASGGGRQTAVSALALTDLTMVGRPEFLEADLNGYTNEDFKLDAKDAIALISTCLSGTLGIVPGDELYLTDGRGVSTAFTVCGVFTGETNEAVVPVSKTDDIYVSDASILSTSGGATLTNYYTTNLYVLKDINYLREFKQAMAEERDFQKFRFVIDDDALNETVRPLNTTITYMDSALTILLVISTFIAFIISFILLKSRSAEIAIMYCVGIPKIKIFFELFTELAVTTAAAIIAGAAAGYGISLNFAGVTNPLEVLSRLALLLTAFSTGAAVSILSSIAIKPMEILTRKEG